MSKSRLEKFLYALYSLDYSDLPTPLSRIEKLYNCLVTGDEVPTFEPLSRVEKYLMAILGGYDVELLPNPLSRVEVLLYKLATGDDNLDDITSFLSEHEELLAEIIRNGGVGGNINIEYVLYTLSTEFNTLYNTAEKPVKSAILSGSTLVNFKNKKLDGNNVTMFQSAYGDRIPLRTIFVSEGSLIKPSTTYLLKFTITDYTNNYGTSSISLGSIDYDINGETSQKATVSITGNGDYYLILTTKPTLEHRGKILIKGEGTLFENNTESDVHLGISKIVLLEYQEGIENWDIPYFEGMQSVKMPVLKTVGKNLFNLEKWASKIDIYPSAGRYEFNISGDVISGIIKNGCYFTEMNPEKGEPLKLNTTYTLSHQSSNCMTTMLFYKPDLSLIKEYNIKEDRPTMTFTTPNEPFAVTFRFGRRSTSTGDFSFRTEGIQLEENSTYTDYEPYKTNILTTNEEVELRGIGDVRDELNLLTGELSQRIGEIVLNGSEASWDMSNTMVEDGFVRFYSNIIWEMKKDSYLICDKLPQSTQPYGNGDAFECVTGRNNNTRINVKLKLETLGLVDNTVSKESTDIFKSWLKRNNLKIKFELATESVKTVDLSVVDQDGNDTKLSTFNDITHVTLSSEGLIPEVELELATKNEEDLEDTSVYTVHTLSEGYNTLYNTAEKPVKSAILKGNTLVNLLNESNIKITSSSIRNINYAHNLDVTKTYILQYRINQIPELTDVTDSGRLVKFEFYDGDMSKGHLNIYNKDITVGTNKFIIINPFSGGAVRTNFAVWCPNYVSGNLDIDITLMEYQEGMENWDIPYFTGMQSVKMPVLTTTGKNLFKHKKDIYEVNGIIVNPTADGFELNGTCSEYQSWDLLTGERLGGYEPDFKTYYSNKILANYSGDCTFSFKIVRESATEIGTGIILSLAIIYDDANKVEYYWDTRAGDHIDVFRNITVESRINGVFATRWYGGNCDGIQVRNIQIEDGTQTTSHEPHKSNILTVNEDVELHGIGDVKDELNCLTGKVTECVGEIVLDGSDDENWALNYQDNSELITFIIKDIPNIIGHSFDVSYKYTLNNKFNSIKDYKNNECLLTHNDISTSNKWLVVTIKRSKLSSQDVKGFKEYLGNNPVIFNYVLLEPLIKTVDLSVVDQDGNDTKLSTFNDITHVTLSSEGLIPEVELEVAEKVPEVAANMLTISREQEVINATTNEQSENVDATMIATTEIYEELL